MKKRLSTLAALAVGATCVLGSGTAHADPEQHCWENLDTGESACFATFAAVVADLSGGRMRVTGGPAAFSQADAETLAMTTLSATAGIVYEDASYGGDSNTYTATAACDASADVDHQISLVGSAWNDRITSFKSFSGCETKLWTAVYSGTGYGWYGDVTGVSAAMNDQASSIQWR